MLERVPIRWRLAGTSAALTFAILCTFAVVVGELTQQRLRSDFENQVAAGADNVRDRLDIRFGTNGQLTRFVPNDLEDLAGPEHAVIRVLTVDGNVIRQTPNAPNFGPPYQRTRTTDGFRIETRLVPLQPSGALVLQYARPVSDMESTLERVRLFLFFGVLGGTVLALLAGLAIAQRAMNPIAGLTARAEEVRRTRDATLAIPQPRADDEVAELARTLSRMLHALDEAQSETAATLARQREFVADASHELRTPLTSVLANLELLAESLDGDQGDAARSALRSSQRMRRLVADLLLLARADAGRREATRVPVDLGQVVVEAASELEPVAGDHDLVVDIEPAVVHGARDDLHRVCLNLLENAIRHTPAGTHVRARVRREGDMAVLSVVDDGPGIPDELRDRVFERFVRGSGDRGGSFGLGLSIVRAVAEGHGGTVDVGSGEDGRGTRFTVRIPAEDAAPAEAPERPLVSARS